MNEKQKIGRIIYNSRCSLNIDRHAKLARIIRLMYPDEVKVSADAIGRYERGENMPPANKYRLIMRTLDMIRYFKENKKNPGLMEKIDDILTPVSRKKTIISGYNNDRKNAIASGYDNDQTQGAIQDQEKRSGGILSKAVGYFKKR